jgi:hypothetical protein
MKVTGEFGVANCDLLIKGRKLIFHKIDLSYKLAHMKRKGINPKFYPEGVMRCILNLLRFSRAETAPAFLPEHFSQPVCIHGKELLRSS